MNIKSIANKLNKTVTEVRDACNTVFGQIPSVLNDEVQQQLKDHFNKIDSSKHLPSSGEMQQPSTVNDGSSTTQTQQSIPLESNGINEFNLSNEQLIKLVQAGNSQGRRLANLISEAQDIGFNQQMQENTANTVNRYLQGNIDESVRTLKLQQGVEKVDSQTQRVEIIDVEATVKSQKPKVLPPSEVELMRALAPSEDELLRLLEEDN